MCQPMRMRGRILDQCGVTLVELIVSIVIISVALSGVLLVMNYTTSRSADPMIEYQAVAVAEAYMEEILLQPYSDPGGGAEGGRGDYDDVDDYNGLNDVGARDQHGAAIVGLENYTVSVAVVAAPAFGPAGQTVAAKKITVTVQHGANVTLALEGYRTDYD